MTINSSPFLTVASGYAIATSTSYLYACYGGLNASAKLARSADGVDWTDDPANITGVGTLVEGPSHIVLTGGFPGPIGAKVLAKSGTTWADIGAIAETTTGGRFIGTHYFVIAGDKLYYSTNTVTWNSITLPYLVRDVGYDGTNYVILTTARIYRTANLSTLTAFPIPFSGHSIAYLDGVYWVSGFEGATPTRIYRSSDLNTFTLTWYSPGGVYANLSVVDGVLVYGGADTANAEYIIGYYYYDPNTAGYGQNPIVADEYTDNAGRSNLVHKHQLLIWNGYVYTSGGSIKRAVYNTDWRAPETADPPVLTLFALPDAVINVPYTTTLGTVADGEPPLVWSGSVTNPGGTSVYTISSATLAHTFVALGTHTVSATVTDDLGRTSTDTTTLLVTDGGGTSALSLVLTNPLPGATVNVPYSASVGAASGGTPPYSWALTTKSWADAASLSNAGVLTTTFTTAGAETLTVTVTDSSTPAQSLARNTGLTVAENVNTATIQGTLRLDTSDGAFAARDVYLYNYVNGEKIAETVSDGTTGAWQFTQVAPGEYFVVGVAQGDDLNIPRDFDALGVITVV